MGELMSVRRRFSQLHPYLVRISCDARIRRDWDIRPWSAIAVLLEETIFTAIPINIRGMYPLISRITSRGYKYHIVFAWRFDAKWVATRILNCFVTFIHISNCGFVHFSVSMIIFDFEASHEGHIQKTIWKYYCFPPLPDCLEI